MTAYAGSASPYRSSYYVIVWYLKVKVDWYNKRNTGGPSGQLENIDLVSVYLQA